MATKEEQREQMIKFVSDTMRDNGFSFEFKAVKNPKGLKIIYELTQEELDALVQEQK